MVLIRTLKLLLLVDAKRPHRNLPNCLRTRAKLLKKKEKGLHFW